MTHMIETFTETEGCDPLRAFLLKYDKELKLIDTTQLNSVYDSLSSHDITYDELLEMNVDDLRGLQNDNILKSLQITRFIKVLSMINISAVYKEQNTSKIIVLSTEEAQAMQSITIKKQKVDKALLTVTNDMNALSETAQIGKETINNIFTEIVTSANKRRNELLLTFENKINEQSQQLQERKNTLDDHQQQLNNYNILTQKLIKNTSIDKNERKSQILALTTNILNEETTSNHKSSEPEKSIIISINTDEIINKLAIIGTIIQLNAPQPPLIEIQSTTQTSAIVAIYTDKSSQANEHQIQYAQCDDIKSVEEDDSKLNWKLHKIITNETQHTLKLTPLKTGSNYVIRASSKNEAGYGVFSNLISFTTNSIMFDMIHKKYISCIQHNGHVFKRGTLNIPDKTQFVVCSSTALRKGINRFRLKCIKPDKDAIGITSNINDYKHLDVWVTKQSDANAYIYVGNGMIVWCGRHNAIKTENHLQKNLEKWEANDIITVIVNCDNWTVTFLNNDNPMGKPMKIIPNIPYYPIFSSQRDNTEYKLI